MKDNFVNQTDSTSSNITFSGNFDMLNASGELEITRAMIYNYLISLNVSIITDIILVKVNAISGYDLQNKADKEGI